jgi:hypothetical protein
MKSIAASKSKPIDRHGWPSCMIDSHDPELNRWDERIHMAKV